MDIEVLIIKNTSVIELTTIKELTFKKSQFFDASLIDKPVKAIIIGYSHELTLAFYYNHPDFKEVIIRDDFESLKKEISELFNISVGHISYSTFADIPTAYYSIYEENQNWDLNPDNCETLFKELGIDFQDVFEQFLENEYYTRIQNKLWKK